ncbi:probable transcriptional regulator SLK2 [Magnolia sinica]|uniref:probable transcriptional regulator SLK2 n=1 Tax=Magnolia sinica TaxID=86752 RepID=UPI0026591993|nr:probable transcriptional regulator SLK2 [Magnolia sinica]XP_058104783.1 probable transcriptional regulator SLK2 [Magnolia sinica]XP_058104785.1 probable transcriptional regulator SLK2 [Magnolia sinica]XP_058104786.1 probable transcriptional regulator SLK2 [Magnolia sinica]
MAPSRAGGDPSQSSSASGIFFQGDGQTSQLNSASSISGAPRSGLGPVSGHMNRAVHSAANSGPSVGASSLVTDANSGLSGGPHLQRSASINTESYLRLPASPMSFSSNNNISISGSSVVDGSSVVQQQQQGSHQDQNSHQMQRQQGAASTATSHPTSQTGQILGTGPSDPNNLLRMQKKPRLDIRQEDILHQQVIQQLLQRQDSLQSQGHNPQLHALIQQQRLLQQRHQQQQILQMMPQMQQAHIQQQQQQQQILQSMPQLKQQLQPHCEQPTSGMKHSYYNGICARRLMQYIYHHRQRPSDNNILYWRKFVAEYFAPRAKKRWCLSLYDNVGHHALGVFPQAAVDVWQCAICGSKSGRGFETTFEVLPRLSKIKFDSGVIDELLFVDMPNERRLPSGLMFLEYQKAIQESIYEQLRVVREGQLRIIFTPDLKILSWEFCARRHEELLPRRLVAPQVNQLVQVAQKYQSAVSESGSAGVSPQDLQTNCNMFVTAGRQLARNLDLQSLNDLGFSKRYVRCLQISEVVSSMKDLIDFSREHNIGPIECLKNYPRQAAAAAKLPPPKMQDMEQLVNFQGLPTDQNTLNKLMTAHPGLSNHMSNNHMGIRAPNNSAQPAMGNYQNLLRQNSGNSNLNSFQQDASSPMNGSNQAQPLPFQGPVSSIPGSMQIASVNGILSPHQQQHSLQPNQQSPHGNQHLQQHAIQQLLQEMMSTNGVVQQPLSGQNANVNAGEDMPVRAGAGMVGFGNNNADMPNNATGMIPIRTNSLKTSSNNFTAVSGSAFKLKPDVPHNLQLADLVQDIQHEFAENGVFSSEAGDAGYDWKS